MADFVVTKKEQWLQQVIVRGVKNAEDAREKAVEGDYEIYDDAQYDSDVASSSWEVERIKK